MNDLDFLGASLRDARAQFDAAAGSIRPALHRYCSRMTGSALDGEDLVQETLAQACYRLPITRGDVNLRPWLFTIAHHKCVDFLRARAPTVPLDDWNTSGESIEAAIEEHDMAADVFARQVLTLPPRERAAIVLKEVLGFSLPEIAEILETSVGAVKAALHRGRGKLAAEGDGQRGELSPEMSLYIDAFNRRDWTGLQALLEEDVRCELVGHVHLAGRDAVAGNYLTNFARLSYRWKLVAATVDGEPAIVCLRETDAGWTPRQAIRLEWRDGRVSRIRDYGHVPYLLADARVDVHKEKE
jgi:RNA polymerase sigma-70 factor (ECF subfamily)